MKHVTPLFLNLHWLPVEQRIIFKIALVTFKALPDFVLSYIMELLVLQVISLVINHLRYPDLILKCMVVASLQLPL